jgi:hypothetical protein
MKEKNSKGWPFNLKSQKDKQNIKVNRKKEMYLKIWKFWWNLEFKWSGANFYLNWSNFHFSINNWMIVLNVKNYNLILSKCALHIVSKLHIKPNSWFMKWDAHCTMQCQAPFSHHFHPSSLHNLSFT